MHQRFSFSPLRAALLTGALAAALPTLPALAHHPMGGRMPSTLGEGLLSGLAHPVIGPDHFAFIVAVGLLAAVVRQGWALPLGFCLAAMAGTGLHLMNVTLPLVALVGSASILGAGWLLVQKQPVQAGGLAVFAAIAGLFHGYAYGEAIFGAEMTPLLSYLLGFTAIQLGISLGVYGVTAQLLRSAGLAQTPQPLRSAGLVLCGCGGAFVATQLLSLVFPAA
jgi:urease accessory protein